MIHFTYIDAFTKQCDYLKGIDTEKFKYRVGVTNCSELETLASFFDKLEKEYPNFREWLMKSCYDRQAICLVDTEKPDTENIAGLIIYSGKFDCKYCNFPDDCKFFYKISTFIFSDKFYEEEINTIYRNFLMRWFLSTALNYITEKVCGNKQTTRRTKPPVFYTTFYDKPAKYPIDPNQEIKWAFIDCGFEFCNFKNKTGESVYVKNLKENGGVIKVKLNHCDVNMEIRCQNIEKLESRTRSWNEKIYQYTELMSTPEMTIIRIPTEFLEKGISCEGHKIKKNYIL